MKIYICLLLIICNIKIGLADVDNPFYFVISDVNSFFFEPKNIGVSNPHTVFLQNGKLDNNKYNGSLNFKIDLNGYVDKDFSIPISINYISKGFMPCIRPSIVGLNWNLNCGGVITRIVKGSPDDTRGYYTTNNFH